MAAGFMTRFQHFGHRSQTGYQGSQPFLLVFLKRTVLLSAMLIPVCCASATEVYAQDSISQGSFPNCNPPFFVSCTDSTAQQQVDTTLQNPQGSPTAERAAQTRDASNNQIYIDQSGSSPRQIDQSTSGQRNVVFSPDPVTDLQRLAQSSTGEVLPIFGRDLFRDVPSTFAPGDQIAAPADYIVGPRDEVLVRLWGPESFNSQLTVDQSGSIYIPKVGAIHVSGLRFDELQQQIQSATSRVYRNFTLTVNLGRLRSIQIYVVGEARRPGAYTISSLSTVLNALFASGGPNVRGSMRHIQIRRTGADLRDFDLYDIVLHGDKSADIRLEPGDTIFIPPVGAQVAVAGSVRHPALYELKSGNTLKDVLDLAGGFSATGSSSTMTLDRVDDGNTRQTLTLAVNTANLAMVLRDADVLYAEHIAAGYTKTVTLRGNLANPGRFAWHPGMKLSEIIPDRMALLTNDYWRQRNRLGVPTPLFEPLTRQETTRLQEQVLSGNTTVKPQSVNNQVVQDGIVPNGVARNSIATDTADSAVTQNSVLSRTSSESARLIGQVGPAVGGVAAPAEQDGSDTGVTAADPAAREAAMQPAGFNTPLTKIQIPAPQINWSYAVIERLDPNTLSNSLVPFNLGRLVQDRDASQDLELQAGDVVTVLSQRDIPVSLDAQVKYVRLEGEFVSPGVYSSKPGETLAELVNRAGGFTQKAYLYGSSFLRESARVFQQQRLDEYLTQLSTDMERALAVRSVSVSSGILDPTALSEQRNIISQLRRLRATGRVVLSFTPVSTGTDALPPLSLENGDVFRVPAAPATVSVIGAVYGQNVFLYKPQMKISDYLSLAGNTNRVADKSAAFVIRADGSILSRNQTTSVFSNHFDNARINPGDAIVVPEKLIRPTALRQLIDYSQVLSSFGLAAAAINVVK